jgi:hypothetical protein
MNDAIKTILDAGLSLSVNQVGQLEVTPATRLTNELRSIIRANKPDLIDFVNEASETTAALIAAAKKRCDEYGDSEAAREQMRQDCINTPTHLQADLLAHFQGKPSKFWN